jgi:hypothetical protein
MTELIRAWRAARRPPAPANMAAVMELYPVGERFFQELTVPAKGDDHPGTAPRST